MKTESGTSSNVRFWKLGRLRGHFAAYRQLPNGKRERRTLKTVDPLVAKQEVDRWNRLLTLDIPEGPIKIHHIIERYLAEREVGEQEHWRMKAVNTFFGHMVPAEISIATCREFHSARLANEISIATIHSDLGMLRTVLNWAKSRRLIDEVPITWRPSKPAPREYRLTVPEIRRLIDCATSKHIALFIRLAASTGARSSAILELTWDRVDFDRRQISFKNPELSQTNKGRAVVPINGSLLIALEAAKRDALSPFVVEYHGGQVVSIKKGFARAAKAAGLPKATPHVLRHSAACIMAEAGVPMSKIAQYLGHSTTKVTESVYARYAPDYLTDASDSLEIWFASSVNLTGLNLTA